LRRREIPDDIDKPNAKELAQNLLALTIPQLRELLLNRQIALRRCLEVLCFQALNKVVRGGGPDSAEMEVKIPQAVYDDAVRAGFLPPPNSPPEGDALELLQSLGPEAQCNPRSSFLTLIRELVSRLCPKPTSSTSITTSRPWGFSQISHPVIRPIKPAAQPERKTEPATVPGERNRDAKRDPDLTRTLLARSRPLKKAFIEGQMTYPQAARELYDDAVLTRKKAGTLTDTDLDERIPQAVYEVLFIAGFLSGAPRALQPDAVETLIAYGLGPRVQVGPKTSVMYLLRSFGERWRYLVSAKIPELSAILADRPEGSQKPAALEPIAAPADPEAEPAASIPREEPEAYDVKWLSDTGGNLLHSVPKWKVAKYSGTSQSNINRLIRDGKLNVEGKEKRKRGNWVLVNDLMAYWSPKRPK
jgi:hypothetical protein